MVNAEKLITEYLGLWISAVKAKSSAGRGSNKKLESYGIERTRELILEIACKGLLVESDQTSDFVELKNVVDLVMGQAPPGNDCNSTGEGTVFVKTGEFGKLYPEEVVWTTNPLKFAKTGDVLICVVGATIGKLNLGIDCSIGRSVAAIRPHSGISTKYLYYSLMPYTLKLRRDSRGSAQGVIGKADLNSIAIRLPPLAEQHCIVAKVDELMALCDQLEQEQETNLETHKTLVSTVLDALTSATADASQFAEAWQRVQSNFDTLFTTESSVDQLKQTILQLAVMGKLVPQDTTNKAASELLNMIAIEKDKLSKSGKIKRQKVLEPVTIDHTVRALPCQWEYTRLGNLINLVSGQHLKPTDYSENEEKGTIPYLTGPAEFGDLHPQPSRYTFKRMSVAQKGDLLITCKGSGVGKLNLAHEQIFISRQLMAIQPILISSKFLMLLIDSLNKYLRSKIVGIAIPGISRNDVLDAVIAIPPLNEQHRIVSKVDELMALCDQLKVSLSSAQETQLNLADSLVEQAIQ